MHEQIAARRQFNKVLDVCPHCQNREPKEIVEMPVQMIQVKEFDTSLYLLVSIFTCGIGLLLFPLFNKTISRKTGGGLAVYCSQCQQPFPARL